MRGEKLLKERRTSYPEGIERFSSTARIKIVQFPTHPDGQGNLGPSVIDSSEISYVASKF